MADETSRLTVEINQTSKGSGIRDTARDTKDLTAATLANQRAAQASAKAVNDLGEGFERGAAAGRVLEQATQGNVAALAQLGPILKGISTTLKANVLGAITIVAAALAPFVSAWIKGMDDAKKKAQEAAGGVKDLEKATGDAKRAAEELGKQQMGILISNLDIIKRSAAEADASFKNILAQAQELDDAQRALALARVDADDKLTEEEKVRRRADINTTYDARRAARPLDAARSGVAAASSVLAGARSQEAQANDQVAAAQARVTELESRAAQIQQQLEAALAKYREEQAKIIKETETLGGLGENREERSRRIAALREQQLPAIQDLQSQLDLARGPEGQSAVAQARGNLGVAADRRDRAAEERRRAEAELAAATKALASAEAQLTKLIPLLTETARLRTDREAAEARARDVAAGRAPATPEPAPAPPPQRPDFTPVNPNDPAAAARNRAAALGAVAAGEASRFAGDDRAAPALQSLGQDAVQAAAQLQNNPSLENIRRLIEAVELLNNGQTEISKKLRALESQIKTARTR